LLKSYLAGYQMLGKMLRCTWSQFLAKIRVLWQACLLLHYACTTSFERASNLLSAYTLLMYISLTEASYHVPKLSIKYAYLSIQLSVSGSNHSALAWVIVITHSVVIGVDSLSLCDMCWWGRQRSARNVKSRSKPKHVISARNCLQRRLTGCTCWPRRCIILSTVCHN